MSEQRLEGSDGDTYTNKGGKSILGRGNSKCKHQIGGVFGVFDGFQVYLKAIKDANADGGE